MSCILNITTPPPYGVGTLPLVTIDFLPSTGVYSKWCLWRASFGVFTGNAGVVYVIRCDRDGGAALEDALEAEQPRGTEGLDFPYGSFRPSRQCEVDEPETDEEMDALHISEDGDWYDLTYAALHEVHPNDLDYEGSLALALAILRRGIEESDGGYLEIERDRVTVGPFEIVLPPGAKRAYRTFDFDARHRYAEERGWSILVQYLIAAGIDLSWVDDQEVEGAYKRVFILADERSCSGPALTER
jgi:hypothetical protein